MLSKIVDIVNGAGIKIDQGTLYCNDVSLKTQGDVECISFLESHNALENTDYVNKLGEVVNLELNLARLNSVGFYEDTDSFISKNRYDEPSDNYYILELHSYSKDNPDFVVNYRIVQKFIKGIAGVSKHVYTDVDLQSAIIVSEEKTLIFPFNYNNEVCLLGNASLYDTIKEITNVFLDVASEKRLLFQNQLISFLSLIDEEIRFEHLVKNITTYFDGSIASYQYYLRDFSYNKLKVELDSKALEFAQKIQSVINDSQVKLIAIPTAFVLAVSAFDFAKADSIKNFVLIGSLFIFSILIQLFLNNQQSTLKFIKQNIDSYKDTFKEKVIENTTDRFSLVEVEYRKQEKRLQIVEVILWAIPLGLFSFSIYLIYKIPSVAIIYFAIVTIHGFLRLKWDEKNHSYLSRIGSLIS